jgi:YVTN family beta-propeller protein
MKIRSPLLSLPTAIAVAGALTLTAATVHAAVGGQAYVSNQSGDISVIDLATLEVTGEIDAYGREPRGVGVTADGKFLVTANREDGNISVIDRASGQLVRHIKIGVNPEFVRTRGNLAFVSFEPSSDGKAPPKAGTPEAMAEADKKDDDDQTPARIAIVDLAKGKVLRTIVGGLETEGIEFAADGKHILVTNEAANTVTVHRLSDGKKVRTIDVKPFGDRPRGIKMAPDGKSYIATLEHGNAFAVIDGKSWKVVKTVPTEEYPYGAAFDRKGGRLYIATAKSKVLQVFDARTYEPIKSVPTGTRCWHFSFTPDDSQILIACGRSNEVVVIDVATLEPVKRIPDKKLPWGVVTYPKSVGSLDRPE